MQPTHKIPSTALLLRQFLRTHPVPNIKACTGNRPAPAIHASKCWLACVNDFSTQLLKQHPQAIATTLQLRTLISEILLKTLFYAFSLQHNISAFALGSFGRSELLPHSDLDLLLLYRQPISTANKYALERLLPLLWDIGLRPSWTLLSTTDCQHAQHISCATSLIDSRFLIGDSHLAQLPTQWLHETWTFKAFAHIKIAEYRQRHNKFYQQPKTPNIKEGIGGLRDLHLLHWLFCFSSHFADTQIHWLNPSRYPHLTAATHFFWQIRHHLHISTGKAYEYLDSDKQHILTQQMAFWQKKDTLATAQKRLISHYRKHSKTVINLSSKLTTQLLLRLH